MAKLSLSYPETGLTISISLKDRDTGIEEFSGVMTEVSKVYKYDFVEVAGIDYIYVATCTGYDDMTGVIYAESTTSGGLTTEEHNKLFSLENSTGGGGFSSQAIQTSISNAKKEIMDRIDEIKPTDLSGIENNLNDIDSHITLAFDSTIESIEQAEFVQEEKEAKKAVKLLTTLDKKVSSYIDSEMKSKDDTSAIVRELNKLDIEDEKKMKEEKRKEEEEKKMKEEEHKKMLAEQAKMLEIEFDKLDEQEQEDKRKELEKELEEAKKEVTEIEKELKSL